LLLPWLRHNPGIHAMSDRSELQDILYKLVIPRHDILIAVDGAAAPNIRGTSGLDPWSTTEPVTVIDIPNEFRGLKMSYTIEVNGVAHDVDAEGDTPLLWVLRDILNMTGTKFGCGIGQCGACTVHANGAAVRSCQLPLHAAVSLQITTIEGVGETEIGKKVQERWLTLDVPQCGYCQGGQIMSATALLTRTPHPTDQDIDAGMAGNICRCGCYTRIRAAIKHLGQAQNA
jgi:isoquinoline 1-oxidoreductase alpha subunit